MREIRTLRLSGRGLETGSEHSAPALDPTSQLLQLLAVYHSGAFPVSIDTKHVDTALILAPEMETRRSITVESQADTILSVAIIHVQRRTLILKAEVKTGFPRFVAESQPQCTCFDYFPESPLDVVTLRELLPKTGEIIPNKSTPRVYRDRSPRESTSTGVIGDMLTCCASFIRSGISKPACVAREGNHGTLVLLRHGQGPVSSPRNTFRFMQAKSGSNPTGWRAGKGGPRSPCV